MDKSALGKKVGVRSPAGENRRMNRGFTLAELMIIVAVVGLLAAVIAPKFAILIEKARETKTKGALMAVKSAIAMYYSAFGGVYPEYIETTGNNSFSRFLEELPPVKATHAGIGLGTIEGPYGGSVLYTTNEAVTSTGRGWRYNRASGRIFVNSSATDSRGLAYSAYGY